MSTDTITIRDIEERVKEIVVDLLEEHGRDRDAAIDGAHEAVDALDWVIYHHKAGSVIDAMESWSEFAAVVDEAWDELGEIGYRLGSGDGEISSRGDLNAKLAFLALQTLVVRAIDEAMKEHGAAD